MWQVSLSSKSLDAQQATNLSERNIPPKKLKIRKTTVRRKDPSMKTRALTLTLGSLLLLALVTVQFGFFPQHVAHAASACQTSPSDANCNGQDPVATGCGTDGTTLDRKS